MIWYFIFGITVGIPIGISLIGLPLLALAIWLGRDAFKNGW